MCTPVMPEKVGSSSFSPSACTPCSETAAANSSSLQSCHIIIHIRHIITHCSETAAADSSSLQSCSCVCVCVCVCAVSKLGTL